MLKVKNCDNPEPARILGHIRKSSLHTATKLPLLMSSEIFIKFRLAVSQITPGPTKRQTDKRMLGHSLVMRR